MRLPPRSGGTSGATGRSPRWRPGRPSPRHVNTGRRTAYPRHRPPIVPGLHRDAPSVGRLVLPAGSPALAVESVDRSTNSTRRCSRDPRDHRLRSSRSSLLLTETSRPVKQKDKNKTTLGHFFCRARARAGHHTRSSTKRDALFRERGPPCKARGPMSEPNHVEADAGWCALRWTIG